MLRGAGFHFAAARSHRPAQDDPGVRAEMQRGGSALGATAAPTELQTDPHPEEQGQDGVGVSDVAGSLSVDQGEHECGSESEQAGDDRLHDD